tara:strand:- start:1637 stop:2974 length:1338 start_codon:yes stop_codon:yes gene_type:complete
MLTLEQFKNKKINEAVTSADRAPQNVTGADGKVRVRMVPTTKKSDTSEVYARPKGKVTVLKKGDPRIKAIQTVQKRKDKAFKDLAKKEMGEQVKMGKPIKGTISKVGVPAAGPKPGEPGSVVKGVRIGRPIKGKISKKGVPAAAFKIDEISPELKQRYADKAFKQYKKSTTYKSDTPSYRQNPKARAKHDEIIRKRHKGIGSSIKRDQAADLQKHGYKLSSKILQNPNDSEAQAKKRLKKGSMTGKSPEQMSKFLKTNEATNPHDDEGANHIIMQLRKSVSLRGMRPVEFKDGKKVKVSSADAQKFLTKYNKSKPMDKEKMQAMAMKSHDGFKKALGESVQEDMSDFERRMRMMRQADSSQKSNQKKRDDKEKKSMAAKASVDMRARRNEVKEDRMAGKYKKGQTIIRGQWPNPDKWAEEYIMPNADKKGIKIYSSGPSFVIEKL